MHVLDKARDLTRDTRSVDGALSCVSGTKPLSSTRSREVIRDWDWEGEATCTGPPSGLNSPGVMGLSTASAELPTDRDCWNFAPECSVPLPVLIPDVSFV